MSLFRKKKPDVPVISLEEYEPVLRCSICTGEQTLCIRDRNTSGLKDLMLVRSPSDLDEFCMVNGIKPEDIPKIY